MSGEGMGVAAEGEGVEHEEQPVEGLPIVLEDARLLVVDKPSGLLSQPGRRVSDSVVERVRAARPRASGPMMMHRLDMDTSGLLVLAKDPDAHRRLSIQFERREIGKCYRAILERAPEGLGGRIELPLCKDIDDPPRQIVCLERGRASRTLWRRAPGEEGAAGERGSEVLLYPLSGRSHQLRVHAAEPRGLGAPILGDRLYGDERSAPRLMLHAERLLFAHPDDGRRVICHARAPFARG